MEVHPRNGFRRLAVTLATGAVLCLFGAPARATLTGVDWKSPGDKLLTLDAATGLQWLDITETTNRSYDDINSNYLGSGQSLEGFRYATGQEMYDFFVHGGLNPPTAASTGGDFYTNAVDLLGLVGINDRAYGDWASGMFDARTGDGMVYVTGIYVAPNDKTARVGSFPGFVGGGSLAWNPTVAFETGGSWLVRNSPAPAPVPEPSTLLLVGSGALGLAAARRRRQIGDGSDALSR